MRVSLSGTRRTRLPGRWGTVARAAASLRSISERSSPQLAGSARPRVVSAPWVLARISVRYVRTAICAAVGRCMPHLGCDEVVGGSGCGAADLRGDAVIVRWAGAWLGRAWGRLVLTVPPD